MGVNLIDPRSIFAKNLRALRAKTGLLQDEVAHKCGVGRVTYTIWEGGEGWPAFNNLMALATFYKVEPLELFKDPEWTSDKITSIDALKVLAKGLGYGWTDLRELPPKDQAPPPVVQEKLNKITNWDALETMIDIVLKSQEPVKEKVVQEEKKQKKA